MLSPIEIPPLPERPLVSVLLACHNYRQYVGEAVASVLGQSYELLELIVCDDGSTDGSAEFLRDLARAHSDRVRFFRQDNAGQAAAINAAYRRAKGEVVCLLDADDRFHPHKIGTVVEAFCDNPSAGLMTHRLHPIDANGKRVGPPVPGQLDHGWIAERALRVGGKTALPPTTGLSFRRAVLAEILPVPAALKVCADGYIREAAQMITTVTAIEEPLGSYRLHGENRRGGQLLTAAHLRRMTEVELPLIHEAVCDFLSRRYGSEVGGQFRLEDAPGYWEKILLLDILESRQRSSVRREALARLPFGGRALVLGLLACLPGTLARPAARFLFGDMTPRRRLLAVLRRLGHPGRWQRTPHEAF